MQTNGLIGTVLFLGTMVAASMALGKSIMKVAYNDNYQPLSHKKSTGLEGIEIELMNELGRRTDTEIVHQGYPWARAQVMVEEGRDDAFLTLSTPERLKYSVMSEVPIFTTYLVAVTSKDNPRLGELLKITSLEDALKFHHVNHLGSGWAKSLLANSKVEYLGSSDAIFKFLLAHRADIYIESDVSIGFNIRRLKLQQKFVILPAVFSAIEFRLGISNLSPHCARMKTFEEAIEKMRNDGSIDRILAKYRPGNPQP